MIRFILKRRTLDRGSGLAAEDYETLDLDVPELEARLLRGGMDPHGAYDRTDFAGVEILRTDQAIPSEER